MVIKSREAADHEANLQESFDNLRRSWKRTYSLPSCWRDQLLRTPYNSTWRFRSQHIAVSSSGRRTRFKEAEAILLGASSGGSDSTADIGEPQPVQTDSQMGYRVE
ncbi:hypothetical protein LIER_21390 [Lithospermum erythrorhizon]|uniref:Uncharacterized protein n=1 Tax=Lithospermum erythrorhizon TaxID=34254 RepID=A0AAV3QRK7_LITER